MFGRVWQSLGRSTISQCDHHVVIVLTRFLVPSPHPLKLTLRLMNATSNNVKYSFESPGTSLGEPAFICVLQVNRSLNMKIDRMNVNKLPMYNVLCTWPKVENKLLLDS